MVINKRVNHKFSPEYVSMDNLLLEVEIDEILK